MSRRAKGYVENMTFDAYTFFSPKVEIYEQDVEYGEVEDPVYSCEEINYGLISFIIFIVGTFFVSGGTMWKKFRPSQLQEVIFEQSEDQAMTMV